MQRYSTIADKLFATRPGQVPPTIPTNSEVLQQLPNDCPTITPEAEVLARGGQCLADPCRLRPLVNRNRHTLADLGQVLADLGRIRPCAAKASYVLTKEGRRRAKFVSAALWKHSAASAALPVPGRSARGSYWISSLGDSVFACPTRPLTAPPPTSPSRPGSI